MADDEQEVQILDNGDVAMDDEDHDAHEMTEMNGEDDVPGKEGVDPETGLSNEGYEGDEETGLILNDSGNKHTVTDSGVEIDGTDSEPNGDQGARSIDGMVDEEDGLLESGDRDKDVDQMSSEDVNESAPTPAPAIEDAVPPPEIAVTTDVPEEVTLTEEVAADQDTGEISVSPPCQNTRDSANEPTTDPPTNTSEIIVGNPTDVIDASPDYEFNLNANEAPWPEAGSPEKHFVYVSSLDPGALTARSEDTDVLSNSSEEIPYRRLNDVESECGLDTDSSIGNPVEELARRPNTSTPTPNCGSQVEPEPPTPPEFNDELNATIDEPTEWPAPPTPISPADVEAAMNNTRSLERPLKPRRSVTSMQYEKPIMAYEIEMDDFDGGRKNEADDKTEETEFKDDELMMAEQDEPADPGGSINDTETATEYENQGTGTITSYENEGELDTPEYTPPSSPDPEENHTAINMENGTTNDNKFSIKRKFIQHEGADDETTRIESRATFKRKTDWKCICLSLLCFIVMVLAAAFAFFIAMFLLGSLDSIFGKDNSEATAGPPMLPEGPTIEAPPIDRITTLAQIRMDRDWNVIYDFPSSPERTMLENNVISALDNTFRWGNTKFVYEKTEIEEFRQGGNGDSIFVRFRSYFYDVPGGVLSVPEGSSTTPSLDDLYELAREQMAQIVFQTLAAAIDTERLETIGALQGTLELLLSEVTRGS